MVQTHIGNGYPEFRHACPRCGESWSNEVITILKKSYFFWQVTFCTILFFFKVYNDRSLQVHFQRHLDSNECVLGNELPYVCETCGKGILLVCLNSFSCFMLFMFFFSDKKYTRLVQSHKLHTSRGEQGMQGVFSILSFLSHL